MLNDFVGDKIEIIRLSDTKLSTLNDALKTITNDVVIVIEERFVGLEKSFQSLADLAFSKNVIAGPRSNAIGRPNYSPVAPARFDAATLLRFCDRWGIEQENVDTDWIDNAAFAVTKQTLETLNYFDERYSTMKFSFADFLQRASTIGVKPVVADHVYFPAAS